MEREQFDTENAKKATDLVLEKLADQNYDPELLDKLNMSKADVDKFLKRWEEMKRKAKTGNERDRRRYERALKSLDFRPKSNRRSVNQNRDEVKGLNEDGAVNQIPPEHEPDYSSFMRDMNKR